MKSTALQRRSTVSRTRRSVLSNHLAAVIDYVHDVIVLLDATGHILFVNRSFSLVTGLDPATRIGQAAGRLVHPEDRPGVLADLRAVSSGTGGGTVTLFFRVEHADGHWVSVEARAVNCLDEPTIRGIVVTMRDRTEELKVVERLEVSEARMRALIEALPDGVIIVDDLRISFANPAAVTLSGEATPASVLGRRLEEFVVIDDQAEVNDASRNFVSSPADLSISRVRLGGKDGKGRLVEATPVPVPGMGLLSAMVVLHDVTEREALTARVADAEGRARFLTDNAVDVLIRADAGGIVGYASPSSASVLELAPEDLIGVSLADMFDADDCEKAQAALCGAVATGTPCTVEVRALQSDDGRFVWVDMTVHAVSDGRGDVVFHVALRDVSDRRATSLALQESAERSSALVAQSTDMIILIDEFGSFTYVSPAVERILGYQPSELLGTNVLALIDPEFHALVYESMCSVNAKTNDRAGIQFRLRHNDGTWRWVESTAINHLHTPGIEAIIVNARDITARHEAIHLLEQSTELLASVMGAAVSEAIVVTDSSATIVAFSRGAELMFLRRADDVVGRMMVSELHDVADITETADAAGVSLGELFILPPPDGVSLQRENVFVRADGTRFLGSLTLSERRDGRGERRGFLYVLSDISDRKRAEALLTERAERDHLTGLANRHVLETALSHAAATQAWALPGRVVLFIDVDHFKAVNDSFGHAAGDAVLSVVGQRIVEHIRPDDLAARHGGDEFVVLLAAGIGAVAAHDIAERIVAAVREPIDVIGGTACVGASVGLAVSHSGLSGAELLVLADTAAYGAKRAGRGRVHVAPDRLRRNIWRCPDASGQLPT